MKTGRSRWGEVLRSPWSNPYGICPIKTQQQKVVLTLETWRKKKSFAELSLLIFFSSLHSTLSRPLPHSKFQSAHNKWFNWKKEKSCKFAKQKRRRATTNGNVFFFRAFVGQVPKPEKCMREGECKGMRKKIFYSSNEKTSWDEEK